MMIDATPTIHNQNIVLLSVGPFQLNSENAKKQPPKKVARLWSQTKLLPGDAAAWKVSRTPMLMSPQQIQKLSTLLSIEFRPSRVNSIAIKSAMTQLRLSTTEWEGVWIHWKFEKKWFAMMLPSNGIMMPIVKTQISPEENWNDLIKRCSSASQIIILLIFCNHAED